MKIDELKRQAANLEKTYDATRPHDRLKLRTEFQRVIRSLTSHQVPVPPRLTRISRRLDDEAYDDMFENMPI